MLACLLAARDQSPRASLRCAEETSMKSQSQQDDGMSSQPAEEKSTPGVGLYDVRDRPIDRSRGVRGTLRSAQAGVGWMDGYARQPRAPAVCIVRPMSMTMMMMMMRQFVAVALCFFFGCGCHPPSIYRYIIPPCFGPDRSCLARAMHMLVYLRGFLSLGTAGSARLLVARSSPCALLAGRTNERTNRGRRESRESRVVVCTAIDRSIDVPGQRGASVRTGVSILIVASRRETHTHTHTSMCDKSWTRLAAAMASALLLSTVYTARAITCSPGQTEYVE